MFVKGQVLYTKVLNKSHGDKQEILLSLLPSDINSELSIDLLAKGNLIMCAVEDIEDHGYLMESGIEGVKAFLPKNNAKTDLKVGELVLCKIQKIKSESKALTLVAFKKDEHAKIDTVDVPSLKSILPGSIVEFNIVRSLKNGLEGLLYDGSISAYASDMHIPYNLGKNSIGKAVKARVLYTMPLSNQIFVTLNVSEAEIYKREIHFGTILNNAKVIKQTTAGVLFNLEENRKGFLPRKTIVRNLKSNFDIDTALLKFSPNTAHTIRVMDYNEIEDCYLCTNDEKLLNEKFFSTYDFKIGQIVTGKVDEKLKNGLKLVVGNVRAFLTGAFYYKTPKADVGTEIRVRVAEIDHDMKLIQVTNLSGFLKNTCKVLENKLKLKVGESFTGVVIKESIKTYCVLFFNHFKGLLRRTPEIESEIIALGGLKVGAVKNFEIANIKDGKILLRLPRRADYADNLGKIYTAKISAKLPSTIQVFIDDLKSYGKIDINHLSEFPSLREPIYAAMKEDMKIKVAALANNQYSRRDLKYYTNSLVKTNFQDVEVDDVLRCYVKSIDEENVELECPLKNFNQSIRLNRKVLNNDCTGELAVNSGDVIYVNVIKKDKNSLYVTPELSKVWQSDIEALDMLDNYLTDINLLINHAKTSNKPFGKYSVGQRVSGIVKTVIGNNLLIELENGVFAQATVDNCVFKTGFTIKDAAIVWMDPINQMIFVTLKEKLKEEISEDQVAEASSVNPKKHKAIVVFFNDYVTVCTVRKANQPLVYIPTKLHYNDFSPKNLRALGNATSKLMIKRLSEGKLLGSFMEDLKVFQKLEKLKTKLEGKTFKRKHTESISSDVSKDEYKRPKVIVEDSGSDDE